MAGVDNKGFEPDENEPSDVSKLGNTEEKEETKQGRSVSSSSSSSLSSIESENKTSVNPPPQSDDQNLDKETSLDLGDTADDRERQLWDSPLEFVLSCIAMSVGLGNIWRFPTTAFENGGGAFLIPYLIVLLFIGRPMYFMEMSMGQFSSCSSVKVWKMVPAAKGLGYAQLVATWCVVTYYCSIIAISIFYFAMSFSSTLPWSVCNPDWSDENCVAVTGDPIQMNATEGNRLQTSAEQYFKNFLLQVPENLDNGPGVPDWRLALCLAVSWIIMFLSLIKGVKSSGKVSYVTAIFPYIGLITLLIKGVTLPGASEGIMFFITPQWEKLLEAKVWYAAVTQSFFSLSVSFGVIVMFSSHNSFRENVYRDATIISLMDTFTSLLGGFTIFSCLGYLKHITGAERFEDVVSGGTTLVFVTYPSAIATFDSAAQVFSVLFFLMLITLGIGSSTALISMVVTLVSDKFPNIPKVYFTVGLCIAGFLMGLLFVTPGGQWVLDLVDYFAGTLIIYVVAIIEIISVMWIFGMNRFFLDLKFMLGRKLNFYWKFCFAFFIPVALVVIFIYVLITFESPTYQADIERLPYPTIALVFGWLLFAVPVTFIPICYFIEVRKSSEYYLKQRLLEPFKSNQKYGPRLHNDRKAWEMFTNKEGSRCMEYWKTISKKALEDPSKLQTFYNLYDQVKETCSKWDANDAPKTPFLKRFGFKKD